MGKREKERLSEEGFSDRKMVRFSSGNKRKYKLLSSLDSLSFSSSLDHFFSPSLRF